MQTQNIIHFLRLYTQKHSSHHAPKTYNPQTTMITQKVIDTLYKQYGKAPKSLDCLDMPLLFDVAGVHHDVSVEMDDNMNAELIIGSIDEKSPFHRLPMHRIHAIVPFENWVAIVMHSSVIFLNKKDKRVSSHLKPMGDGFMDRLRRSLAR